MTGSPWDDIYEEKPTPPAWVWVLTVCIAGMYVSSSMGYWGRL